jgi:outer membrane immunogenic protein
MALGRLAVALGVLSVSSAAAIAADMSLPPRPYAPAYYHSAVVYEWTGFYIGLSAGGGFGLGGINNNVTSALCSVAFIGLGCDLDQASSAAVAAVPGGFDRTKPSGFIGGGQIGYNYQMGWFVWGVEADFSGADISGSNSKTATATVVDVIAPAVIVNTATGTANQKLDWLGTLRGRVGFVPFTPLLVYATGGLAYGHVSIDTTLSETATVTLLPGVPGVCPCSATSTASTSSTQFGWTVGGGAEWMFAPHWSLKAEFLYYDLGHVSADMALTQFSGGVPFTTIGITSRVNFNGDIARGGINYRF